MTEGAAIPVVLRSPGERAERARSTEGRVVYAIGDIHGRYDLVSALLEAIVADMATIVDGRPPLLVFCGDYVDRGPQSSQVLTALVWLSRQSTLEIVFLRGNHEVMLLDFLDHPDRNIPWLRRDGAQTLMSYGVDVPGDDLASLETACRALRDRLLDKMPASHLAFLRGLPIRTMCGDYLFVHAGLMPRVSIARQSEEDCLWIGEEFLSADYRFDKIVVHGHSWSADEPEMTANRIGIDTGAYSTGVLTAVRLEGDTIVFLQARTRSAETSC
ncbi:metallophosphoesterase family protein [Sphingomonas sp. PAMC 26617]|uniref:metallophosphoesterase family protein n=1 Tax=Sphingomonas sp. PAMC 26617 TaxID=1112216 RepID=UPI00028898AA|nr:metallophosphoesterase family protein [Sphingomonas sp. PAMC 26617]